MRPIPPRILILAWALTALAHADEDAGIPAPQPALKPSPSFDLALPGADDSDKVTFVRADRINGETEKELEADGNVEVRRQGMRMRADHVHYQQSTNTMEATGHVRLERQGGLTASGPHGVYDLDTHQGYLETPFFTNPASVRSTSPARGDADFLEFVAADKEQLTNAEYTTCPVGRDDWYIRAQEVNLDHTRQVGEGKQGTVDFFDVPILYSPTLSFPLNNEPKSGFLAPTIGATATTGQDYSIPYYFRLAPNFDDTLNVRTMSKRGIQIGDEFRYLEPSFGGSVTGEYMPNDIQLGGDRWLTKWVHRQDFGPNWHLAANVQEASDPNYLNDLNTMLGPQATIYLPHDLLVSYTGLPGWTINVHSLSYQSLFGAIPQYNIQPQVNANWAQKDTSQLNFSFTSQYTAFWNPNPNGAGNVVVNGITYNSAYQSIVDGSRLVLAPSVTLPFRNSYSFLNLKTTLHFTDYELGDYNTSPQDHYSRTLPITSVDGGLFFERDSNLFQHAVTQTLEPRLYYVYIPYRDQSKLPIFDTALADFNPVTIFTENQFSGIDRINNANQVTAALTSRLLDNQSGIEVLKGTVAQRFYFTPNSVLLPNQTYDNSQASDILLSLAARITQRWRMDSFFDVNQHNTQTQKVNINTSYSPGPGKVLNLSFRSDRNALDALQVNPGLTGLPYATQIRQWDVSSEWPVTRELSFLGRIAYSTINDSVVEGLMGLEYNQGCWALRVIATRFAVSAVQSDSAFFVQLELGGMGLGQNPLQALRRNIPGYMKTNEITQ